MRFIYYKQISSFDISVLEYVSSISTALVGNYCNSKRVGRSLSISNQKRKRTESSVITQKALKNNNFWLICQKLFQPIVDALIAAQKKERKGRI
jgi:hypothetical protein